MSRLTAPSPDDVPGEAKGILDDISAQFGFLPNMSATLASNPTVLDALVAIVTAVAPTPVNVLISPADKVLTVAELQKAGVKRISVDPALYTHAMEALQQATEALVAGDLTAATTGISFERISELLALVRQIPPGRAGAVPPGDGPRAGS